MVRLERLREYVEQLKTMKNYSAEEFTKNALVHGATERYLHLAIESLLDIGNHIIAERAYRKPETYGEIFEILAEKGVIPEKLYRNLEGMTAFRNLLVHDYTRLDRGKVYNILQTKLPIIEELGKIYAVLL